jgi:hypothetical protein
VQALQDQARAMEKISEDLGELKEATNHRHHYGQVGVNAPHQALVAPGRSVGRDDSSSGKLRSCPWGRGHATSENSPCTYSGG